MANKGKDGKNPPNGNSGKGKMTFVMFQLEGSDETLQDGFRAMEKAFEKMAAPGTVYIQAPPSRNGYTAALPTPEATDDEPAYVEAETVQDSGEQQQIPRQQQSGPPRKRRALKAVEPLKDVDWENSVPFRTYAEERNPGNNYEKFLVVGGWFRDHRGENTITPSHVVSGFDVMDWTKPEDVPQTFRSIASEKEWFQNVGRNQWEVGQRGLNHLDRLRRGDGDN